MSGALALTGCSSGSDRDQVSLPKFEPNRTVWHLPIDDFLPDTRSDQYASNLLYGECMSAAGARTVVLNPTANENPTRNSRDRRLFDVRLASKYGYEGPTFAGTGPLPRLTGRDAVEDRRCSAKASQQLGYTSAQNQIQGAGLAAASAVGSDPRVVAAIDRWRRCMLPLGIPDLSESPTVQPSPSQKARFRQYAAEHHGSVSVEEIREATFDAKCQASSGYAATAYKVECEKQLRYIEKNPDLFARALDDKQRQEAEVRKVLARHGR